MQTWIHSKFWDKPPGIWPCMLVSSQAVIENTSMATKPCSFASIAPNNGEYLSVTMPKTKNGSVHNPITNLCCRCSGLDFWTSRDHISSHRVTTPNVGLFTFLRLMPPGLYPWYYPQFSVQMKLLQHFAKPVHQITTGTRLWGSLLGQNISEELTYLHTPCPLKPIIFMAFGWWSHPGLFGDWCPIQTHGTT